MRLARTAAWILIGTWAAVVVSFVAVIIAVVIRH